MKTTKRVLAVLLALALGLALFAPMAAAADPVITGVTPKNAVARIGQSITFTVEAQLPEGAEGPLTYQWYQQIGGEWQAIAGATTKSLTVTAKVEDYISAMFDESGTYVSLNSLVLGLAKQYRVEVACGEGIAFQEVEATFSLGFIDSYRAIILLLDTEITNLAIQGLDDMYGTFFWDIAYGFIKVLLSPFVGFVGLVIWLANIGFLPTIA